MTTFRTKDYPVGTTFNIEGVPADVCAVGHEPSQDPNIPTVLAEYVFRREFLRELLVFLREPAGDAFYVAGPTGSGKTSGITEVLGRLNWPCQQITAHGRLEMGDLIGQYELSSANPGETPSMKFKYGVLPRAMKLGHVLLINEIDYCDPSEISGLNDILEGRPLVLSETGGEIIYPHPMFRIIATGNSIGNGDVSGLYRGIQPQNIAFMDRYRVSTVGYMDREDEIKLLDNVAAELPKVIRDKMVDVAGAVRTQFLGESGTGADGTLSVTMSTRTVKRWAKLAAEFKQHPTPMYYAMGMALTNRAEAAEATAIHKIAGSILGDTYDQAS